jgi:DNA-binding NarL/FixJ family response regulator
MRGAYPQPRKGRRRSTLVGRASPVRLLIADDQVAFAAMLETILAEDEEIEVVGRAANGREAVDFAAELEPDVVLMDISMPLMDGLEATRRIREREPSARVLMLTESDLPGDAVRAERAGADGYVPKTRIVARLRSAILDVASR